VDCVGFEARGTGAEGSKGEVPAQVLNDCMSIVREGGKIGIPGESSTPPSATASGWRLTSKHPLRALSPTHSASLSLGLYVTGDPGAADPAAQVGNPQLTPIYPN
jgi:hypothetical protein